MENDLIAWFTQTSWLDVLKFFYETIKEIFAILIPFLFALSILWALIRLERVIEAFRQYKNCSDSLPQLLESVDKLREIQPELQKLLGALRDSAELAHDRQQVLAQTLQQMSTSEKAEPAKVKVVDPLAKWETIRNIWENVRQEIEKIIDNLSDGRRKRKYDNMDRYNYKDIINTLENDKALISSKALAARNMNSIFHSWRVRDKTTITAGDVEAFKRLQEKFV